LAQIGPPASAAVPALIHAIEDPGDADTADMLIRFAIRALGRIGPKARAAVPVLKNLLGNGDVDQFELVKALDGIGVPPLRELLEDFLDTEDSSVADALAWIGPKAREISAELRNALRDKRPQIRFSAAVALAYIEPSPGEAIPVLIDALSQPEDQNLEL